MVARLVTAAVLTLLPLLSVSEYEDSRISLLPRVLPALPGVKPLEQARAQALASFLHQHRLFGDGGCDVAATLCLPIFVPIEGPRILPLEAQEVLQHPTDGPILINFAQSLEGETPTNGLTYIASAGDLIFAPFAGEVLSVTSMSAKRTRLTLRHSSADQGLRLTVLTGQFESAVIDGAQVETGQPLGRARPVRDASTRLQFNFWRGDQEIDPEAWLPSR